MGRIANNVTELIGNTPLVRLSKLGANAYAEIIVKLEYFNPGGSIKDRTCLALINAAEKSGQLKKGGVIIEPTSGNTGVSLAMAAAIKNYKLILTMPETISVERRKLIRIFGAEIILTPGPEGMNGAIFKAKKLASQIPNSFMPQQFNNHANPETHRQTTANEIWEDTDGKVDIIIAGVGTGGTVTGVAEVLKKRKKSIKAIAVEPYESRVLSGGQPGFHRIHGIGAGFIPETLNLEILDEIIPVKTDDAIATARKLASEEGILVGISSGATVYAAIEVATRKENKGKQILAILPDTGERYLGTPLFDFDLKTLI